MKQKLEMRVTDAGDKKHKSMEGGEIVGYNLYYLSFLISWTARMPMQPLEVHLSAKQPLFSEKDNAQPQHASSLVASVTYHVHDAHKHRIQVDHSTW